MSTSASAAGCGPSQTFKTVWKTDNVGTSNSTSITIPTTGGGYSYQVDWNNDGDFIDADEAGPFAGDKTHDFGVAGTYEIGLCGTFPRFYFNNGGDKLKLLDITQWGDNAWGNMQDSFKGATNLVGTFTDTANTSNVQYMVSAFEGCVNFNGDITGWDTSNVIYFDWMFRDARNFNQPLNGWNTSSAQSISGMFAVMNYTGTFNQPLDSWDVSNVSSMAYTFFGQPTFNQNLNSWDTSALVYMQFLFYENRAYNQPMNNWVTNNVTDMESAFFNAQSFNQSIGNWNTSSTIDMYYMFTGASNFNQNINTWDTSNVTRIDGIFNSASNFNQPLNNWDVSNVTSLESVFSQASRFNQDISSWDVSNVTNFRWLFHNATDFNQPLNTWSTTNVTIMYLTFSGASSFNQPLNNWDVSNVTDARRLFMDASSFNQNINNWNVGNFISMDAMFRGASSFNQPLDNWDLSGISEMNFMFMDATSFNQNINTWDVSSVIQMFDLFNGASSFNQPLDNWDTSSVVYFTQAFHNATSFNQNINTWDVSSAQQMYAMFERATSFNQPLSSWNPLNVQSMYRMFAGATSFNQPIGAWNVSSVGTMTEMFAGFYLTNCTDNTDDDGVVYHYTEHCEIVNTPMAFNQDISGWNTSVVGYAERMFAIGFSDYDYSDTYVYLTGDSTEVITYTEQPITSRNAFSYSLAGWDVSSLTNAEDMLNNTSLEVAQYDDMLIGWSSQVLQNNTIFGATGLAYCTSASQRESIITSYSWVITDDGEDCVPPAPSVPVLLNPVATNVTEDTTPTFRVTCSEADHSVTLFVGGVEADTASCDAQSNADITVTQPLTLGVFDISATETNTHNGTSPESLSTQITLRRASINLQSTGLGALVFVGAGGAVIFLQGTASSRRVYRIYKLKK